MLGKALEILIITCMKNHVYRFDNQLRVQANGGPIGLALTGEVAECYMMNWDKKFLRKTKDIGIEIDLYSRFKDDILISATDIEKGTRLVNGNLVLQEEKKIEDKDKTDEGFTMEIIQQVANEVDPMIKFTVDVPSNHKDNKLPVLDLTTSINKKEGNRIDYEFFEKPNKNPKLILANSALNARTKRTVLTQECLRRLRNTKIELGEEVRNSHLNKFMLKMKNSGYSKRWRIQILDSALKAFDKMVDQDQKGNKPLYRNRSWNLENRKVEKNNKVKNWYKGGSKSEVEYKSILFVPSPHPWRGVTERTKEKEARIKQK